jgi:hypothetical protein
MSNICVMRGTTLSEAKQDPKLFKDAAGREWFCRVDWAAIRRSEAAGVDLSSIEEHLGAFHRGSIKLVDALWAVLQPAAETKGVTLEQFELGIRGTVLDTSREALLAGVSDFFPPLRSRLMRAANAEVTAEIQSLVSQSTRQSIASPVSSE